MIWLYVLLGIAVVWGLIMVWSLFHTAKKADEDTERYRRDKLP